MTPIGGASEFVINLTTKGIQAFEDSVRRMLSGARQVDGETKKATRGTNELGRSFRNIALRTAAYIGIVRGFRAINGAIRGAISTGIEYNEVIEQSRLAIASLISAQADLVTANGEVLTGVEELDAAYELATEQVRKLRIAGIQTAATTKELVDAFQQAVGAGIASGLTLDEIRQVTIRIAQAAGALGVPYRQLNEEIRSLLSGTIDQNTRIAKALQIQNEQVVAAREQNKLADFLLGKFEAFGVAGERIVETWGALRSNVQETFELLSGEATFPLFDALRSRGLIQLSRVFDFDTAEISSEFAQIIKDLQRVFGGIGDQLAGTLEGAVDAAARFNIWLTENNTQVTDLILNTGEVVSGIAEMVRGIAEVGIGITKAGVEMGVLSQLAETAADTFKTIGRSPLLSATAGAALGGGILAIIGAVIGPTAVIVTGVTAAIGGLISVLDSMSTSAAEATEEIRRLQEAETEQLVSSGQLVTEAVRLSREYGTLAEALREQRLEGEELTDVQTRMAEIIADLAKIDSDWAIAVEDAVAQEGDLEEAIKGVIRAMRARRQVELVNIDAQAREAQSRADAIQSELDAQSSWVSFLTALRNIPRQNNLIELNEQLTSLAAQREDLEAVIELMSKLLTGDTVTLETPDTGADLENLRAAITLQTNQIKEDMKEAEAELKFRFDNNLVNYVRYYDELTAIQQEGLQRQIELYRQLAAAEDDPQRAASASAKAVQLETEKRIKLLENETARRRAGLEFANEAAQREADFLQAIGNIADATRVRLTAQFEQTIAEMKQLGARGAAEIKQIQNFIDIQVARAQLQELEAEITQAQQRIRDRIQEIQLQADIGQVDSRQARRLTAEAYEEEYRLLAKIIPLAQEYANIIGDPAVAAQVAALVAQLRALGIEIEGLNDEWKEFRDGVADAAVSNLSSYLSDAVIEANSLGEAFGNLFGSVDNFRNLVGQLAADIVQLISRMIAMEIVAASFSLAGLPAPSFARGGMVKAASGGLLAGPGTGTSDSILARVSDGEYIVRAAAVKKYGPEFLHQLNAGALPRNVANLRRFASGGMVNGVQQPTENTKDFRGELAIGLGEGLVVDQMDTPAGERLILRVIQKNRRSIFG